MPRQVDISRPSAETRRITRIVALSLGGLFLIIFAMLAMAY
jgi:hypothetical protein